MDYNLLADRIIHLPVEEVMFKCQADPLLRDFCMGTGIYGLQSRAIWKSVITETFGQMDGYRDTLKRISNDYCYHGDRDEDGMCYNYLVFANLFDRTNTEKKDPMALIKIDNVESGSSITIPLNLPVIAPESTVPTSLVGTLPTSPLDSTLVSSTPYEPEPSKNVVRVTRLDDDYTNIKLLGEGGLGTVYRATRKDGRVIALKVITGINQRNFNRAVKEVSILMDLSTPQCTPYIVCYYDYFYYPEQNTLVIEMEYIEGDTFREYSIKHLNDFNYYRQLLAITRDISSGLAYVHQKRIIHGDIKPDNIMITYDMIPKLVDFGIACETTNTCCQSLSGTPDYRAPEVVKTGTRCFESDMWSLGVTLYYLATGRYPFVPIPGYTDPVAVKQPIPLNTDNIVLNNVVNNLIQENMYSRFTAEELELYLTTLGYGP